MKACPVQRPRTTMQCRRDTACIQKCLFTSLWCVIRRARRSAVGLSTASQQKLTVIRPKHKISQANLCTRRYPSYTVYQTSSIPAKVYPCIDTRSSNSGTLRQTTPPLSPFPTPPTFQEPRAQSLHVTLLNAPNRIMYQLHTEPTHSPQPLSRPVIITTATMFVAICHARTTPRISQPAKQHKCLLPKKVRDVKTSSKCPVPPYCEVGAR